MLLRGGVLLGGGLEGTLQEVTLLDGTLQEFSANVCQVTLLEPRQPGGVIVGGIHSGDISAWPPHGCSALCVRRKIPVISPVHLARRWLNDVMGDDKFKWA